MVDTLEVAAPEFVEMAHRIVWATAATVDTAGNPSTRILHPVWQWDGSTLTGWIATSPVSTKAKHLAKVPRMSLTY
jgi:pyridoxine/pyridoxamine 5'-phosphate oxidase